MSIHNMQGRVLFCKKSTQLRTSPSSNPSPILTTLISIATAFPFTHLLPKNQFPTQPLVLIKSVIMHNDVQSKLSASHLARCSSTSYYEDINARIRPYSITFRHLGHQPNAYNLFQKQ